MFVFTFGGPQIKWWIFTSHLMFAKSQLQFLATYIIHIATLKCLMDHKYPCFRCWQVPIGHWELISPNTWTSAEFKNENNVLFLLPPVQVHFNPRHILWALASFLAQSAMAFCKEFSASALGAVAMQCFFCEEKWHIPNMGHRYTNRMILIIPVYDVHDLDPIDERRKDTAIFLGEGGTWERVSS